MTPLPLLKARSYYLNDLRLANLTHIIWFFDKSKGMLKSEIINV